MVCVVSSEQYGYGYGCEESMVSQECCRRAESCGCECTRTSGCKGMAVGSYRRGNSSSGDVDILFTHPCKGAEVGMLPRLLSSLQSDGFLTHHLVRVRDDTRQWMGVCKVKRENSVHRRIDIKVYTADEFPFALLYFTGSAYFNRSMRNYVDHLGFSLSDKELTKVVRGKGNKILQRCGTVPCRDEKDIFHKLGLAYVSPKDRNM
uniref:DNA polymerase n=1 Tax=Palpitomonas bilix TaxID=652834 RepID=A0A7S3DCJ0_9EUKA|mmetsp:Transcript_31726/g.82772  ORF Transcript_31726/g.82772 Transcript_31726/m.82772 type:complete len:205 (+) Transcript_31726:145-759(+)